MLRSFDSSRCRILPRVLYRSRTAESLIEVVTLSIPLPLALRKSKSDLTAGDGDKLLVVDDAVPVLVCRAHRPLALFHGEVGTEHDAQGDPQLVCVERA